MINLLPYAEYIIQNKFNIFNTYVRQHGALIGEFHTRKSHRRANICSAAKSVTSIGIGIAIDEGLITLDTKPEEILKSLIPVEYDPKWNHMTVKHLLTMSPGHSTGLLNGYSFDPNKPNRDAMEETNWIKYVFEQPLTYELGTHFVYNNAAPYLLLIMMIQLTSQNFIDWCRPRIFEPMDIRNPQWQTDPQGRTIGCGGIMLNAEDLGRFGQLLLDGGMYAGKRIISEEYVRAACSHQIDNRTFVDPSLVGSGTSFDDDDSVAGYGYYIWRAAHEDAYYLAGWGGQYAVVLPHQDAVVSFMSHDFNSNLLDAVWKTIVPQLNKTI